jgi:hypothetical protein
MKKMCLLAGISLLFFLTFIISTNAEAGIIYVKHDATGLKNGTTWTHAYTTIQEGIDAAVDGDEVWVAKGTYYPTSSIQMKNGVTIIGGLGGWEYPAIPDMLSHRDLTNNTTTINGSGNKSVIYHPATMSPLLDNTAVLDGFTITNGRATSGGGIHNNENSPTFKNCIITACQATSYGNGIYNYNASPKYYNCSIVSNTYLVSRGGGGIQLRFPAGIRLLFYL